MPDIVAQPLRTEELPSGSGAYVDLAYRVDGAGNSFRALATENPEYNNTTWVEVEKITPSGQLVMFQRVMPPAGFKIDDIDLTYSGTSLIVAMITHSFVAPRRRQVALAVLPGVWGYREGMERDEGGAGAFVPPQEPQEAGVTEAQVRAIVNAAALGITGAIKGKVQEALREERVLTESMFAGGSGSATVYQQLRNTSYSGAKDAIEETHNQP